MSKKCKAYSASKLGLEAPDTRKAFYAGWDAAIESALRDQRDELLSALRLAVRQNSHDMLMTGEELRQCEAAIAKIDC